ncbi:MAG TPA: ABC transporter substrate-binding protein [Streptosporangiaceae bacterium]|nr:ABC transporter substrate-binding protein [Streptosporangiaceae bacterium]
MLTPQTMFRAGTSVALISVCAACVPASDPGSPSGAPAAGSNRGVITVGSFDFPESGLLAEIYGQALAAHGFRVRIMPDLGNRELVDPALMSGLIQVVPEYAGSALEFVSLGRLSATSNAEATNKALAASVNDGGLVVGRPAPAQDSNAIVVTAETAARYRLRSIADLARVAPRLMFGGPPECPGRPYCLPGLEHTYGVHFRGFIPLDAGGPLTLQALEAGDISAALLFSTNPSIRTRHLVVLADDRGLQPAENITPLIRRDAIARYGAGLVAVLDKVSARLNTGSLRAIDALVQRGRQVPRRVAASWLRTHGLMPRERAVR